MFTAVLVFMLIEKNRLNLNDKINKYLPSKMLENLFVYKGIDYSNNVTIMNLLGHTSGCSDYFEDKVIKGNKFKNVFFSEPDKFWTPEMTLEFVQNNQKAVGKPSECFHYSDTSYNLLGKIVEFITNRTFQENLHDLIFNHLQMDDTYLMYRSVPKNEIKSIEKIWLKNREISNYKSLSCDWAGGGIISTVSDLLKFSLALQNGKLINNELLTLMKEPIRKYRNGMYYGLGQMSINFKEMTFNLVRNLPNFYGHSGLFSTQLYYEPNTNVHIIINLGIAELMAINSCFSIMIEINKEITKK